MYSHSHFCITNMWVALFGFIRLCVCAWVFWGSHQDLTNARQALYPWAIPWVSERFCRQGREGSPPVSNACCTRCLVEERDDGERSESRSWSAHSIHSWLKSFNSKICSNIQHKIIISLKPLKAEVISVVASNSFPVLLSNVLTHWNIHSCRISL